MPKKQTILRRVMAVGERRALTPRKPTDKQREILDFVKLHKSRYGFPPTRRETADAFGFSSANAIQQQLDALVKKGYIRIGMNFARAIEIVEPEPA